MQDFPKERIQLIWTVAAVVGGFLALRLVQLQVLESAHYRMAAERNRTQMIYQRAPRGRLYDRNGVAVAANRPAFSLIYLPSQTGGKAPLKPLAEELGRQLRRDPGEVMELLEQATREHTAVRLAENLPTRTMFRLSELKTVYPGVDLVLEAQRYYPLGRFASHLIGYMGRMDPGSWQDLKKSGYRMDSLIGRLGLESVFEQELRGQDGGLRMEVNARGQLNRILERIPWEPGSDIHLTIDAGIQQAADEGLRRSPTGRGAAVALDPSSGAILAFSSAPDFDPNALLSSDPDIVEKTVATLPEFNNAISGVYPPGSTFKPIVSIAGLEIGRLDPAEQVYCPGYFELGRKVFLCWQKHGHKTVSFLSGFANSCDVYFYKMGLKIGSSPIEHYAELFGLGAKTRVALKGEKAGHLFGPAERAAVGRGWYDGDTLNLAVGQGELLVTPIQMAAVAAAIASRGAIWRPHYTNRIEFADGHEYRQKPERLEALRFKDSTWDLIYQGMELVVTSGTAHGAIIPGLDVRGKTGTAENPGGEDHAWFIAFASRPGEPPAIALAVLVENGGHGSTAAAPIARSMIVAAFRKEAGVSAPAAAPALTPERIR